MSTYLGNSSLSSAVKDRVISTFEQSIVLYKQGRTDEVIAGCGLILQMDPQFDPARKLLDKARNPMLPIDVDRLVPAASAADALKEAHEAMRTRDFQRVINITTEVLTEDLMNDEARILGDDAREKMEAAPFVEQFLRKFDQNLANGDTTSARATLEKARSLDADHPAIAQMEAQLAAQAPPAAASAPPQPPPSFVVETPTPPATGRGTAQAADFGFTFEEQKPAAPAPFSGFSFDAPGTAPPVPPAAPPSAAPAGFSFDTPAPAGGFSFDTPAASGGFSFDSGATTPAPAPAQSGAFNFNAPAEKAPATGEFDFGSASFETSPEDRRKIEQYLADGDRAIGSGDYQQAIDLWSRIFLIDVTNEQASERIEKAKAQRRDIESQTDEIMTAATAAFDRHDLPAARKGFDDVLRIDPSNTTARDYLTRIGTQETAPAAAMPSPPPAPRADDSLDFLGDDEISGSYTSSLTPPEARAAATPEKKKAPAPKAVAAKKALPLGAIAAVVGVLILAAGGWFAYSKFFGKNDADAVATRTLISEATRLTAKGQYDAAIALLQEVKPEDPQHDRAVIMIADLQHKKSQASETIDGKPAATFYMDQLTAGRAAYEAHDYDGAKKAFEQAVRVKPLAPDMKALYDTAAQQVAKLDTAKSLFRERRFDDALATLVTLQQQDPQNKNIQRMIVDSHFNLGATALQDERIPDAIREFDEVLKIDPSDDLARRSKELATRYNGQAKDLLYKIYVKYLPMRQVL